MHLQAILPPGFPCIPHCGGAQAEVLNSLPVCKRSFLLHAPDLCKQLQSFISSDVFACLGVPLSCVGASVVGVKTSGIAECLHPPSRRQLGLQLGR